MDVIKLNTELNDFNFMSDIHADFYIKDNYTDIVDYFDRWIDPDHKSNILIIAGDISHSNKLSASVLKEAAKKWKYVFFVSGNHDFYDTRMLSSQDNNRIMGLLSMIKSIPNVFYMRPGMIFEFNNRKMAGCNLWYDMQDPNVYNFIRLNMNDAKYVGVSYIEEESKKDLDFYNEVINDVDVFVSHVPTIDEFVGQFPPWNKAYYRRVNILDDKVYVYGHMHEGVGRYIKSINSHFLTKPVGYNPSFGYQIGYFRF